MTITFAAGPACGQEDQSAVRVAPRTAIAGRPDGTARKTLEANVNLVLVPVLITDSHNRPVNNLTRTNFSVFDNGQEQAIRYFSREDAPISIGIVFDRSGSMNRKLPRAREAMSKFMRASNPADEYFVVTVSDRPELLSKFTRSVQDVEHKLIFTPAMGHTALLDAIELALKEMRRAINARRCLLVITDGGDNHSRTKESDVKSLLMESDILLYSVGVYDQSPQTEEERLGPALLAELAEATGGRNIVVNDRNNLPAALNTVATELHSQYLLGYYPLNPEPNRKWHEIKVKLIPPNRTFRLQNKSGYFAADVLTARVAEREALFIAGSSEG